MDQTEYMWKKKTKEKYILVKFDDLFIVCLFVSFILCQRVSTSKFLNSKTFYKAY